MTKTSIYSIIGADRYNVPRLPALVDNLRLDLLDASADDPARRDGDDDDEGDEDALDRLRASVLGC